MKWGLIVVAGLIAGLAFAAPGSQPAVPTIAPIQYFQEKCARCHGDYGSNYGDQFARNLNDAQLSKEVDDMCSGPGNAPLSGIDLQAEIAFHRALADGKPFLCITKLSSEMISGEISPGATLVLQSERSARPAIVNGTDWSIKVSPKEPFPAAFVATLNGQKTTVEPGADATLFSHAKPASQPAK